jgi:hypothetical protein
MLKNLLRLYALTVIPEPNQFMLAVKSEFKDELSSLGCCGVVPTEIALPMDFESKVHYLLAEAVLSSSEPQWHQLTSYLDMWGHKGSVEDVKILTRDEVISLARVEKRALASQSQTSDHEGHPIDWAQVTAITSRIRDELTPTALGEALRCVKLPHSICRELGEYLHIESTPVTDSSEEYKHLLGLFTTSLSNAASSLPSIDLSKASIDDIRDYAEELSEITQGIVTGVTSEVTQYMRFLIADLLPEYEWQSDSKLNAYVVVAATKAAWKIAERYFHPSEYGLPCLAWLQYVFDIITDNEFEINASANPFLHINKDPYGLSLQCQVDYLKSKLLSLGYEAESIMEQDGFFERLAELEGILYQSPLIYVGVDSTVTGKSARTDGAQVRKKKSGTKSGELRNKLAAVVDYARSREKDLGLTRLSKDLGLLVSHIDIHLRDLVSGVDYHEDRHGHRARHYSYLASLIKDLGLTDIREYEDKWEKVMVEHKKYQAKKGNLHVN